MALSGLGTIEAPICPISLRYCYITGLSGAGVALLFRLCMEASIPITPHGKARSGGEDLCKSLRWKEWGHGFAGHVSASVQHEAA